MSDVFRETERLLNKYFKVQLRIERLNDIISKLECQADEIKKELSFATPVPRVVSVLRSDGGAVVPVGGYGGGGSWGGSESGVDYEGDGSKGLDAAIEKYDELLVRLRTRYLFLRRRIWLLKVRVQRLEEEAAGVGAVVGQLDDDEKMIIEQRYVYKRSNYAIAKVMSFDEKTIRNKKREIVLKVADYLGKIKGKG